MDFSNDDELDYEEDDLENDSVKNDLESKSSVGEELNQNSNLSEVEDQYLQVNCTEEEKNYIDKAYIENINFETKNVGRADEGKKPEPEKPSPPKEESLQTKNSTNDIRTNKKTNKKINKKFKKRERSFHHTTKGKKQVTNSFSFNQRFPKWNLSNIVINVSPLGTSKYSHQTLNFHKDIYSIPSCSFPLIGFNATSSSGQRFGRRRRNFSENFRIGEGKKICYPSFLNQNTLEISANSFNECRKSESNLFQLKCHLRNEERELIKLKKEARLKRFLNDEVIKKESIFKYSTCENEISGAMHLGQEYLKKIEEQKLTRENLLILKNRREKKNSSGDNSPYISTEKPDINKEILLKKRNPFDSGLKTSNCMFAIKIKEENQRLEHVKQEISDTKLLVPISEKFLKKEEAKILAISESSEQRFGILKNGASFPVKFVRTVSKTFDELALRKPKMALPDIKDELSLSSCVNTLPFVATNKIIFSTNDFPSQVESQLTGCIVKVFNIPPSITTNDVLALCSPIGIVKEMKINLPKENSVVIRFAEPSCAENFFSVYHGQKMNNYFLNVIVV